MLANATYLNGVSAVGLLVMLGLAWLMRSHKTRVNWRLVITGVSLQLILAAIFFNSQNWRFDRQFTDFSSLQVACDKGGYDPTTVPDNKDGVAFAPLLVEFQAAEKKVAAAIKDGTVDEAAGEKTLEDERDLFESCLLYTSPSPRDRG